MKTVWDPAVRAELRERIGRLTPEAPRRWGTMSAPQMIAHLVESLRMAIGELPVAPKDLPLRYTPIKQFVIYWMPFPKGAPTAPELVSRVPTDWPGDCASLTELLERFAARGRSARWPDHPAFGTMSAGHWGVLVYRHMDHHLRQFGG